MAGEVGEYEPEPAGEDLCERVYDRVSVVAVCHGPFTVAPDDELPVFDYTRGCEKEYGGGRERGMPKSEAATIFRRDPLLSTALPRHGVHAESRGVDRYLPVS